METKKSILLVTVDCLRADHVGFMGYKQPTTPFLDSLAGNSFVIPTAIVAGAPTYYSLPGILASRFPLSLGRDVLGVSPSVPTLASVLKEQNYVTAACAAGNPYISSRFGYDQGFDTFRDFLEGEVSPLDEEKVSLTTGNGWAGQLNHKLQKIRPALGPLGQVYDDLYFEYCQRVTPAPASLDALRRFPSADVIVDHACEWLTKIGNAPFLLWLHLMDPHSPYYPKEAALEHMTHSSISPYRARYLNSYWNRSDLDARRLARYREEVVALHDAGIRWVDEQISRLIGFLRRSNRWEDCIFALTADHGEEFLDHGGRYHPPSRLMEELIHVPLLLRVPGITKREVSKSQFSLIHLAPTLLDAVELPVPLGFQGQSHFEKLQQGRDFVDVAISECVAGCTNPFHIENRMGPRVLSVRESRFKLVLHFSPAAENLYDLEADPGERSPLPLAAEKPTRRRLLEIACDHIRNAIKQRDDKSWLHARLREFQLEWAPSFQRRSEI
jgi:arylsulfatase A-like enzyme